jgi:hypothetical protein
MTAALPRYATVGFIHLDRHVHKGEEVDAHDELVALRPDLFTTEPPKPAKAAAKKEAT